MDNRNTSAAGKGIGILRSTRCHTLIRIHSLQNCQLREVLLQLLFHDAQPRRTTHQYNRIDVLHIQPRSGNRLVTQTDRLIDLTADQIIHMTASQVVRPINVVIDYNLRFHENSQINLRIFALLQQLVNVSLAQLSIFILCILLVRSDQVISNQSVKVASSQQRITSQCQLREFHTVDLHDRHIERTTTQIVDQHILLLLHSRVSDIHHISVSVCSSNR